MFLDVGVLSVKINLVKYVESDHLREKEPNSNEEDVVKLVNGLNNEELEVVVVVVEITSSCNFVKLVKFLVSLTTVCLKGAILFIYKRFSLLSKTLYFCNFLLSPLIAPKAIKTYKL